MDKGLPVKMVDFDRHRWPRGKLCRCRDVDGQLFYFVCMGLEKVASDNTVFRRLKRHYLRPFRVHVRRPSPCPLVQRTLIKFVVALFCRAIHHTICHRGANRRNGSCSRGTPSGEAHVGAARTDSTGMQLHVDRC